MNRAQIEDYKRWLRLRNCILCGDNTSVQVAHVRMHDPRFGKDNPGMGIKNDKFMLSMCSRHHNEQTNMAESEFWEIYWAVDPHVAASALLNEFIFNNGETADKIVEYWNREAARTRAMG